ncbi:hypothetical protein METBISCDRAFT_27101 [Metschnikowia bicuspidata]|uniref:Transcription regulator Rua1 C-terminal domain-containing protein n=1 Tax=Metschnikowia bicuspidata TaxID=27322 RepID=A0A4P9ZDI5_9ASCO|nr:hypothetical protein METBISCDRAFT_27101 [Metschnikowia bicuspidata]
MSFDDTSFLGTDAEPASLFLLEDSESCFYPDLTYAFFTLDNLESEIDEALGTLPACDEVERVLVGPVHMQGDPFSEFAAKAPLPRQPSVTPASFAYNFVNAADQAADGVTSCVASKSLSHLLLESDRSSQNSAEGSVITPLSSVTKHSPKYRSFDDLLALDVTDSSFFCSEPDALFTFELDAVALDALQAVECDDTRVSGRPGSQGGRTSGSTTVVPRLRSTRANVKRRRLLYSDDYEEPRPRGTKTRRVDADSDDYDDSESKSGSPLGIKPVHMRFKSSGFITLEESTTQCLDVDLNYHQYTGVVRKVIINNDITNFACLAHSVENQRRLASEKLMGVYQPKPNEESWGKQPATIGLELGVLQRKIYIRDISEIENMVAFIHYEASDKFHEYRPYEPQYFRYERDENNNIVGESKCGMCAFCPEVKFYPFKNSSYLSHMTLMHGVFANNYVIPEGLYVGKYKLNRTSYSRKKSTIDALQCPVCFQTIPIKCWRTKKNPLLSYFRHFKKQHQRESRTFIRSHVDPVQFEAM